MNFISMTRQDDVAVELKYCERCGGLWLRRPGQEVVFCARCRAQRVALLRAGRGQNSLQINCLRGVAEDAKGETSRAKAPNKSVLVGAVNRAIPNPIYPKDCELAVRP